MEKTATIMKFVMKPTKSVRTREIGTKRAVKKTANITKRNDA